MLNLLGYFNKDNATKANEDELFSEFFIAEDTKSSKRADFLVVLDLCLKFLLNR